MAYYVTVVDGTFAASRVRVARGPFPTHEEALAAVEPTRLKAQALDPWTDFLAWGTTKTDLPASFEAPMNRLFTSSESVDSN